MDDKSVANGRYANLILDYYVDLATILSNRSTSS